MNRILPCCFIMGLLIMALHTSAQQDLIWTFGKNAGLDFTSGSVVPFKTSLDAHEGCASVSRPDGSLAFYTDGGTVYNDRGLIMPNGALFGTVGPNTPVHSTSQGALIVPSPDDTALYYLFSIEEYMFPHKGNMYYSIIDMRLRNGRGDVVSDKRRVFMDSVMTEKMTAVPGGRCNIWVMTRSEKTGAWKAWSIDRNGLDPVPVESHVVGIPYNYLLAGIRFSPDRKKMVSCSKGYTYNKAEGLELYDFDPNTGVVSNPLILDTSMKYYQACFSPDNSKVYAVAEHSNTHAIYQFDLSLGNAAAIAGSKTLIHGSLGYIGDIRLSPYKTIYFVGYGSEYVHIIPLPDNPGTACGLQFNAIRLAAGTSGKHGLPNVVAMRPYVFPSPGPATTSCPGRKQGLLRMEQLSGTEASYIYTWMDDQGAVLRTHTGNAGDSLGSLDPGQFTVHVSSEYGCDTSFLLIVDSLNDVTAGFNAVDTICLGAEVLFENTSVGAIHYTWNFGDKSSSSEQEPEHRYTAAGTWQVVLVAATESCADTVSGVVVVKDFYLSLRADDTLVNRGQQILLQTASDEDYAVLGWYPVHAFADQTGLEQRIVADTSGMYWVSAETSYGCADTAYIRISVEPDIFMPSAFTPNNDGRNDFIIPRSIGDATTLNYFRIYDRWGTLMYHSNSYDRGWDGSFKGSPVQTGTYFYLFEITTRSGKVIREQGDLTLIR